MKIASMTAYDHRLARAVYAMVLLAVLALVLAEGAVVYFAIASVAALISWPIAHGKTDQSAVPRWLISLAVLLALLFFFFEFAGSASMVSPLAHFIIFIQVCKFFETKRARDYGQLLVLSMLEMVVAAILSSSLVFAVILVVYLAWTIYTLLLFHFKREMELFERTGAVRSAGSRGKHKAEGSAARGRISPVAIGSLPTVHAQPPTPISQPPAPGAMASAVDTLNAIRDRRFWRISASTGTFALVLGTLLFVCFPRVGEGMLNRFAQPDTSHITGFTESPRLGSIGKIKESDALVMWVTVLQAGRPRVSAESLMLRGGACWRYNAGQWSPLEERLPYDTVPLAPEQPPVILAARWPGAGNPATPNLGRQRELRIELGPLDSQCLFAPYPPLALKGESPCHVAVNRGDLTLTAQRRLPNGLHYSVWTPDEPAGPLFNDAPRLTARQLAELSNVPAAVIRLARDWTAGLSEPYAQAEAIQGRLLGDCRYTLQMLGPTDTSRPFDPLEVFLLQTKAGHCQYFASAMAVMCQQLGIPARIITGFKGVEYNPQGEHYIIRQKHAHSWVEAYFPDRGWVTFDPTPAAGDSSFDTPSGLWGWLTCTMDYMNYRWQQRVINYSRHDRQALMSQTQTTFNRGWQGLSAWFSSIGRLPWTYLAGLLVLTALVWGQAILLARRHRLHAWPLRRQVRQLREQGLGFWADLLALLHRRRLVPAAAWTPLEIADDLARRWPQVDGLHQLAISYYKVRYGSRALSFAEQVEVRATLAELSALLGGKR